MLETISNHRIRGLSSLIGNTPLLAVRFTFREQERVIYVEGGRSVRLSLTERPTDLPEMVLPAGHLALVNSVAYSKDGRRAMSAGAVNVIVWDAQTGSKIRDLRGDTTNRYVLDILHWNPSRDSRHWGRG